MRGRRRPELRLAYWDDVQDEASEPEVTTGDFTDNRLTKDGGGVTIFYGDPDADIPKPPNAAKLDRARCRRPEPERVHHHRAGRRPPAPRAGRRLQHHGARRRLQHHGAGRRGQHHDAPPRP